MDPPELRGTTALRCPLSLAGRLHRQRQLSRVTFLIIRDRSGHAQVVVGGGAQAKRLAGLAPEMVVSVTGRAVAAEQAPGGVEVHEPQIEVIGVWRRAGR